MKFFLAILFCITLCSLSVGQSAADHTALREAVEAEKYDYMAEHDPARLDDMAYANRHGYYVSPVGEKGVSMDLPDALEVNSIYPNAPAITLQMLESGTMNRILYNFDIPADGTKIYRIGSSTDRILIIMSPKVINLHKLYQYR